MNPTENNNPESNSSQSNSSQSNSSQSNPAQAGEALKRPIIGYCRATGKALTVEDAVYVNGVLYSKDYSAQAKLQENVLKDEAASPYSAPIRPALPDTNISPGLAFLLGLIPGVGAIYNGQYAKGLVHIVVLGLLATLAENHERSTGPLFGFLITGWVAYMAFEAFHTAQKRQRGLKVTEMSGLLDLPANLQRIPVGPLVLILAGVVFLLDNLGLLPIEQLARFWPVLLILTGLAMLLQRLNPASAVSSNAEGNSNAN